MPRTDENGRGLQAVLNYLLDGTVPAKSIYTALGIARNTYHGRIDEADFPDAEECRLVAEAFDLNPVDLQMRFGLVQESHLQEFLATPVITRSTSIRPAPANRLEKLSDLQRRPDVSTL